MFVCERNTGYEAGSIKEVLERIDRRSVSVRERADRDYGWWTSNTTKIGYATAAREALVVHNVRFAQEWAVCATHPQRRHVPAERLRREAKVELGVQLHNVRAFTKQNSNPTSTARATVSGKLDDAGRVRADQNDDLFITLGMACFFLSLFEQRRLPNFDFSRIN